MISQTNYPPKSAWAKLCARPVMTAEEIVPKVRAMIQQVQSGGDAALLQLTEKYDGVKLERLTMPTVGETGIAEELKDAIRLAAANIEAFHRAQVRQEASVETQPGVRCWRKAIPITTVGLYVPGGTAPLFSTLLMLAIPAKIAGCKEIVVCTPPNQEGSVYPAILFTAQLLGIEQIYTIGGAQAVAAMAYGTATVPKCGKIFGPGNQWVTVAKQLVQMEGLAIDMPAGPSEVLVVADAASDPAFVAADLLSQAEHGPDSQVILVSDSADTITATLAEVEKQLAHLPRKTTAAQALAHSQALLFENLNTAMAFSNQYAPEHLIINTANANFLADQVVNAGSVFIGPYSCESAGDYATGTNHTLPTNGFALSYSGVSLDSFYKQVTFQQLSAQGLQNIGPAVEIMAAAEQLEAHKNAVTLRLQKINANV